MSNNGTEQVIISAKANVMVYDDVSKKWNPSGSSPGLSKVYIYQNLLNQTYRVVGRKVQDHECVINCMLSKSIKYQANQTFLQWRDTKQVYGLHFGSKDETDHFTQVLKTAVENLTRVAANSLNMNGNGDNISLGKRSISSEYTNPLITDEYERQQQFNGMNGHHQNGANIYTGINTQRPQQQQQNHSNHNQVTSPPLSNSSSSSSSTISSNGLLNTMNGQPNGNHLNGNHMHQTNGHMNGYPRQNGNHDNNNNSGNNFNSYPNNQLYNLQQQNNQQINTSSTSSSSSSSSTSSVVQQPLYQSSPIPPPPPPPMGNIFGLLNGASNNNSNSDNHSQKIYDVIPDNASYTPNHNSNSNSAPPPPPLPMGLFNTIPANGAPPPPPPIASMQSLNLNGNHANGALSNQSNSNSMASELAKSIANRQQLKKVDEPQTSNRQTAPAQLDFLTEIRQKLEAKNRNDTAGGNPASDNDNLKPSNGLKKINRNGINSDSPKPIKKITSTPVLQNGSANTNGVHNGKMESANGTANGHLTNGYANGHIDGQSYDKLKQELMCEFRKELQMIKQDIVNSILNELRR